MNIFVLTHSFMRIWYLVSVCIYDSNAYILVFMFMYVYRNVLYISRQVRIYEGLVSIYNAYYNDLEGHQKLCLIVLIKMPI